MSRTAAAAPSTPGGMTADSLLLAALAAALVWTYFVTQLASSL